MRLSKDRRSLKVNDSLTVGGIPPEAFEYRPGNRNALEWVIDQYQVTEDKHRGIRSDPNRPDDPEYTVRLVVQVIRAPALKPCGLFVQAIIGGRRGGRALRVDSKPAAHKAPGPGKDGRGCWLSSRASIMAASNSFRFSPMLESCKAFFAPMKTQLRSSWVCRNCSVAVCHD